MEVCLPLRNAEELLEWQPYGKRHTTSPLCPRKYEKNCPKTLVCHDMKGGYLEDRYVHGIQKENCFSFIHWSVVDIFVYFSHCLVTIPPCGWITAAHKNGTLILGTLITEWKQGEAACDLLLKEDVVDKLCNQLVHIAVFHGFDGWLINIENKMQPHQVEILRKFVEVITQKMHAANENGVVIWYDSVISTGELKWQNTLNEKNRMFFDCCDGIFLNYNWKHENLEESVKNAGPRIADVYVGVDVFGRGCYGGGGFCANVAVKVARDNQLSVAIFAPGWIYECLAPDMCLDNTYKFWDLLSGLCFVKKLNSLPFSTTFCPGFGSKMYRLGKVISEKPWFNLGLQEVQPSFHYMQRVPAGDAISVTLENAYNGGGCLQLKIPKDDSRKAREFKIINSSFVLKERCIVNYAIQTEADIDVTLVLRMSSFKGSYSLHLIGDSKQNELSQTNDDVGLQETLNLVTSEEIKLLDIQSPSNTVIENWTIRTYLLQSKFQSHIIESIDIMVSNTDSTDEDISVFIGLLQVIPTLPKRYFCEKNIHVQREKNGLTSVKCFLEWSDWLAADSWHIFYEFCGEETYLVTTSQHFYHANIKLDAETTSKKLDFHLYPIRNGAINEDKMSVTVTL